MQPRLRLGQLLVDAHIVSAEQLEQVLTVQKTDGRRLGTLLVESGLITETQLTQILSQQLSVPWVSLYHIDFSRELLNLIPRDIAEKYCLVPIYIRPVRGQGDTLYVAMDDPMNEEALRDCAASAGLPARPMIAAPSAILKAIRLYYGAFTSAPAPSVSRAPPPSPPATPIADPRPSSSAATPHVPNPATTTVRSRAEPIVAAAAAAIAAADAAVGDNGMKGDAAARATLPTSPGAVDDDAPVLEVREVELPRKARRTGQVALTLLDGTTIQLPTGTGRRRRGEQAPPEPARLDASGQPEITAAELLAALRAAAHGADATEVLGGNVRWEKMMAAVLAVLLRKHLIQERELMDELRKI